MKTIDFNKMTVEEFARMLCGIPNQEPAKADPPPALKITMPLAYVFGPYRAPTEYQVKKNIEAAEAVALQLWRLGLSVICPHKNTANFGGALGLSDQVWLDGDLEMIRRCDLLVGVEGWEKSEGSKAEVAFAKRHGITVYASLKEYIDSLRKEQKV